MRFGYRRGLPEGAETWWGARLIFPSDLLWDRQDAGGPNAQLLCDKLDKGPLDNALERARYLSDTGELRPEMDREVLLYDDDEVIIKANPQRSYGYLYACAYFA